jgi:phage terminase large subunit-like protein
MTQRRVDIREFARLLKHTESPFTGQTFVPEPWQDEYLDRLFNTLRPDGRRQYQRSLLALPRKQGKTAMCAVIGAYEGFFGEAGGQILIAAGDRKQASLLFTACSRYIESCPGLLKRCKIYKNSIVIPSTKSVIQFLSSEHKGKHGFMEREAGLARESVAQELKFRTLYLNQWCSNGANKFFRTGQFEACSQPLRPSAGRPCYCGLDLSSTQDTTAFAAVWPGLDEFGNPDGTYDATVHVFIPEKNIDRSEAPYRQWAKDGFCTISEGDIVDYDVVRDYVLSFCEENVVRGVAIDRWNATHITTQLVNEGIDVKPYGQGYASMSAPTKLLELLVIGQKLRHGGNPPLTLHTSNLQVRQDDAGNIKPTKSNSNSTSRIDAAVALIMALGLASAEVKGIDEDPQLVVF